MSEIVDHKARADAAAAIQWGKQHEKRCDERMERVEEMFKSIKGSTEKLWEAVDDIRAEAKTEGFFTRDRTIRILRWAIGIVAAALVVSLGWHIKSAAAHYPAPDWIMDGGYQTAETPASRNNFGDTRGTNCCGPSDCKKVAVSEYRILSGGNAAVTFRGHEFVVEAKSVFPSEDAFAWFCAGNRETADPVNVIPYCLFIAPSFTRRHPP